jgi:hypothetical protein
MILRHARFHAITAATPRRFAASRSCHFIFFSPCFVFTLAILLIIFRHCAAIFRPAFDAFDTADFSQLF